MSAEIEQAEAPHQTFDTLLVIDFGSMKAKDLKFRPKGIILSGGPASVYEADAPHADPDLFEMGIEGICYGLQQLAWRLSPNNVISGDKREYGKASIVPQRHNTSVDRLFEGVEGDVWMSHGDKLSELPTGFCAIASTQNSPYAGIAHEKDRIFGIQFHPEVSHTPHGKRLLRNFAVDICGAKANWTMSNFIDQEITRIRNLVGDKSQVLGAVSGGVDSTVAAKLMKEAIGDRFHAVLVDHGLMRLNECAEVKETLGEHLGIDLTVVDASEKFMAGLSGVTDPERKRKFIGNTFIDVFEESVIKIEKAIENTPNTGKVDYFLQGTLYLGINEELVMRHPFPGPGIAIRILGDVTPERVRIARQADHIFISMIKEAGLYGQISQAYAAIDTNKVVGVMGDNRVEGYIVILRAVVTTDFMTAEAFKFDMDFLMQISTRICNEVNGVSCDKKFIECYVKYTDIPPELLAEAVHLIVDDSEDEDYGDEEMSDNEDKGEEEETGHKAKNVQGLNARRVHGRRKAIITGELG
ncbi:hypothetical protein DL769_004869 [Monosporascus sp. CRB-8-3]|nr:hypothetical protein DL769_004869 [Monosporascus sp. CRB-8-3]